MQSNLNHGADVALFIDWENFKISLAVGNRTPNVSALKEEVSNHGRVVIAKAYADWVTRAPELRGASQFLNDPPSLYAAGIEPVFVPTRAPSPNATNANGMRTGRIKNSVDVKMTADCIEIAHSYPNIGTFVLVSGDSDFIHVVNALRTMGKHVIVVGISWSTSRRLADQVDTLVLYDVDVDPPETIAEPVEPSVQPAEPALDRTSAADLNDVIRAIEEIIRDERKAGGNPLLTSIKQRLVRRYPDFDEKKLGYTGFKRLMARAAQNGNVRLITAGLVDWAIMADEDIPEGATEATFSGFNARPGRRRGRLPRSRQEDQAPEPEPVSAELDESSMVEDTGTDHEPDHQIVEDTGTDHEPDHQIVPAFTTNGQQDLEYESEDASDSPEGDSYTPSSPFADNQELAQTLQEAISSLGMPTEPDDGQQADRVSDLIFMANTLEHQEGISHVAFNFLVSEICDALGQGIEAGHADITQRWGQASSRTYVSKMLRSLSDGEFFLKGNHSWRDENSGQNRRRRTFNLNHDHSLVQQALAARSEDAAPPTSESDSSSSEPEEQQESQETSDSVEQVVAAAMAELPGEPVYEDDDEDYESGKNAAEARAETGFMSRLFNTRRRM
ncbi:Maebl [hydrothermal vent metagenome]|uniref:Maebl n=1 Tax=hydrothermal vent metagenome TaxID=652676 RepID=A0A160V6B7_9ZZZZ